MTWTEEQIALRRTAREVAGRPWAELARLGFAGLTLPGGDGGFVELGIVLEEQGRKLAAAPFLSTVVLGGGALRGRPELVARIVAGETLVALAHDEGPRHRREVSARLDGGRVAGDKTMVLDGNTAAWFVVSTLDGLVLVPASAASVTPLTLIDGRDVARVRFDGAAAEPVAADLGALLDRGAAALAAEMLGAASEVFERTVEYLKTRRQFGVPIGSFQALKHRAAQLHIELELTRSVVWGALHALDAGAADAPMLCSAAKARATDTFVAAAAEAVQMHGGIGVTEELGIGRYLKRARVAAELLGDAAFHRRRLLR